jgi:glutaminyl-tRNA synthetase
MNIVVSVRIPVQFSATPWLTGSAGFSITPEELHTYVTEYISSNTVSGWDDLNSVISRVKGLPRLRWASPLEVKNSVEKAFTENFGTKDVAKPKGKVS